MNQSDCDFFCIGQIVFDGVDDTEKLSADIKALEKQIHKIADEAYPSIKARGGGYQRIKIIRS